MSSEDEDLRGFTAWKLDVLNAMSVDGSLSDLEFRVAFRIMQHVNSVSRIAWPSVARLAAQLDKSEGRVRAATRRLQDAGWLMKRRKSQRESNEYGFLSDRVPDVLDDMADRMKRVNPMADDRSEMNGQVSDDRSLLADDRSEMHGHDRPYLDGKHLIRTTLEEHLQPRAEQEASTCYGQDDNPHLPYPVPTCDQELADMLGEFRAFGFAPAVVGFFRRQLMEGKLTPAMVEEQMRVAS